MQIQPRSLQQMIDAHRSNGLLIDTNLLLLLVIGTIRRNLIGSFKRTQVYRQEDFQRVVDIRKQFTRHWTTPNILTETDNLGRQLPKNQWPNFAKALSSLTCLLTEQHIASSKATKSAPYIRLGLSDSVSLMMGQPLLVLTDDFKMHGTALSIGVDAINLNHLRYSWQ